MNLLIKYSAERKYLYRIVKFFSFSTVIMKFILVMSITLLMLRVQLVDMSTNVLAPDYMPAVHLALSHTRVWMRGASPFYMI